MQWNWTRSHKEDSKGKRANKWEKLQNRLFCPLKKLTGTLFSKTFLMFNGTAKKSSLQSASNGIVFKQQNQKLITENSRK